MSRRRRTGFARAALLAAAAFTAVAAVWIGGLREPPADVPTPLYRFAAAERRLDGDPERTLDECRGLLETRPDYPGAHLLMGAALMKLGRHDRAEAALLRAAELDPRDPDVHWLLGNVVLKTRIASAASVAEAAEHLLRSVELDDSPDLPPAAALLREQLALYPQLVDQRYRLGLALLRQGNAIAAMWDFRDVLALEPDHAGAKKGLDDVRRLMRDRAAGKAAR